VLWWGLWRWRHVWQHVWLWVPEPWQKVTIMILSHNAPISCKQTPSLDRECDSSGILLNLYLLVRPDQCRGFGFAPKYRRLCQTL
jgi:hypothetical protein